MRPVCDKTDRPPPAPRRPLRRINGSDHDVTFVVRATVVRDPGDACVGGPSRSREPAAYEPDYFDDAADMRNWSESRRDGPSGGDDDEEERRRRTTTTTVGFLPSTLAFRPYEDQRDDDRRRQEELRIEPGRGSPSTTPRGAAAVPFLRDEMTRARPGRPEQLSRPSVGRKSRASERLRSARLRRRISEVKRDVEADLLRRRAATTATTAFGALAPVA